MIIAALKQIVTVNIEQKLDMWLIEADMFLDSRWMLRNEARYRNCYPVMLPRACYMIREYSRTLTV